MKTLIVMATWICCMTIVLATSSFNPTVGVEDSDKAPLRYTTITLDLQTPTKQKYSTFLTNLRTAVRGEDSCSIITTRRTAPAVNQRFVLAELKVSNTVSVTLGIDVLDLYVVGYRDRFNNRDRANFLRDASTLARDNLFPGATVRNIPYGGRYQDFEAGAGNLRRNNVDLGLESLKSATNGVHGKSNVAKSIEGKFFLIAVQMVNEAARFRYIENQIPSTPRNSVRADPKVIELENSWGKVSKAIIGAQPACVAFKTSITLKNDDGTPWIVSEVSDIRPDVGVLKFTTKTTLSTFNHMISEVIRSVVDEYTANNLGYLEPAAINP